MNDQKNITMKTIFKHFSKFEVIKKVLAFAVVTELLFACKKDAGNAMPVDCSGPENLLTMM